MNILKYKKFAFTLAEVLLTLTIIGIVAALTIPALINTTNDSELKAAWEKDYAVISQAYTIIKSDNKFPTSGGYDLIDDIKNYLAYSKFCIDSKSEGCWHATNEWTTPSGNKPTNTFNRGLILNNGTYITSIWVSSGGSCYANPIQISGNRNCVWLYVDVNGKKPPNVVTKDIFTIEVQGNKIMPMGSPDSFYRNCKPTDTSGSALYYSIACSAQAFYQ